MRTYLDCLPCFLRQALDAARRATRDEKLQRDVLNRVASIFPGLPLYGTPIELGREIHGLVREVTGVDDPYREAKRSSNDQVIALLPEIRRIVEASTDRLRTVLELAAAGNAIDLAIHSRVDVRRAMEHALEDQGGMVDYPLLLERLQSADDVLYVGDNAGEIVFDKLVVAQLVERGKRVTFVVRGRPILNDATIEDARYVGMDDVAEVMASGSDGPGTALALCTPQFVDRFQRAGLILCKGQGNFEGLSGEDAPLFFLLQVKCPVVADELGVRIGRIVLRSETDSASYGVRDDSPKGAAGASDAGRGADR